MKYVITGKWAKDFDEDILCYHEGNKLNDGSKGDGYFYTSLGVFFDCLYENTSEHPFIFNSRREAKKLIKRMDIHNVYRIRKFPFTA